MRTQGCSFCGASGTCLAAGNACPESPAGQQYTAGCPSRYTGLILAGLVAYLVAFSPGLGPVPWVINAEIFPLHVRPVVVPCIHISAWSRHAGPAAAPADAYCGMREGLIRLL